MNARKSKAKTQDGREPRHYVVLGSAGEPLSDPEADLLACLQLLREHNTAALYREQGEDKVLLAYRGPMPKGAGLKTRRG